MSRSARRLDKSREANCRRFFATVEQLERRDLLIWAPVTGGYSGDQYEPPKACDWLCPIISTVQSTYQAVMDFVGHFDGQSGNNSVAPRAAGASSGEGFLPNYSTRSQRGVLASGNITIPNGTTYTSLKMETTFNSATSASRYFDPSGLAALDVFQVGEWLDVSGLAPGRYPYHMDFTAYYSGGSETFDYDGYVLVGGAEDELISDGWTIGGVDRLTVSTNGALWETGDGSMYWFADAGSTYTRSGGELTYSTLTENVNGTFTLSDRWGGSMLFSSAGLLTTKTDRDGNETNFAYIDADSDSQTDDLSEIELFDGTTMDFTYTSGQLTSITDFDGRSVALAYNGSNQLESLTFGDPDSTGPLAALVIGLTYESITGYLATVTVGSYVTEYTYGFTGAVVSRENPDGTVENFSAAWPQVLPQPGYGTSGSPAPAVNVNDIIITKENADGETTSWVLGTYGRVKKMIDALGNVTTFTLDTAGRVTKRTDPDPDGAGSLSAPETDYGYDSKHNLTSMQLPDGTDLSWTYDSTWNVPTQSTDELGLVTIYTVNSTTGNVTSVRQVIGENDLSSSESDDIVTEFTYYALGTPGTDPPAGLAETMTDGLGRDTLYDYNARGLVTSVTFADGTADEATIEKFYNSDNTLDYELDELDRRTDYDYDLIGRVTKITLPDPDGGGSLPRPEVEFVYDVYDRVVTEIDPLDRETYTTYDSRSRVTKIEKPDHDGDKSLTTWELEYTKLGLVEKSTDPLDRETVFVYDELLRQTKSTLPDPDGSGTTYTSPVWEMEHDNLGRVTKTIDPLLNETLTEYANYGREVTVTLPDPDGAGSLTSPVITRKFDPAGNLVEETDANGNTTTRAYDVLGRLSKVTTADPDGGGSLSAKYVVNAYDKAHNLISSTDDQGNVYSYTYDNRNRLTKITAPDPDGTGPLAAPETEFEYSDANELTKTVDPLDRTTENTFDGLGRLITVTLPDPDGKGSLTSPQIKYAYDAASRKTSMTDALGNETKYGYDLLDNLIQVTEADPDGVGSLTAPVSKWKFNAASELIEATDPLGNVTTYTRDNLGRLTETTLPDPDAGGSLTAPVISNTYDANNNLLTVTDPLSHVTEYAYDDLNRRISVEDPLSGLTTFLFDANSNLEKLTDPVGNETIWTYDAWNRVVTETNELAETRLFGYDQAGNLRMRTDRLDRVYVLSYDNLQRMTREDWWQIENFPTVSVAETTAGSKINEVQQVGFSDATAFISGTFTLTYSGQTTSSIAWDADEATVDAALEALSNIGNGDVSVVKSTNLDTEQVWTVTFTGALAGTNVAQITIDATSVYNGVGAPTELETTVTTGSTINEEQTVTLSGATTGYYRLLLNGYYTAPIAYNASAGTVETTLEALTNIDNVTVTGSAGGPYTITFGGAQSGVNVSTLNWRPADTDPLANSDFVGSLLYEYDAAGQLTDAFYQDGSLQGIAANSFSFDGLGRVTNETMTYGGYSDTITLDQEYDAGGNRTQALWSFGTTEQFTSDYTYDALNRLTELTRSSDEQADYWHRAQFSYNKLGQFLGISRFVGDDTTPIGVADTDFTYDDLNRLLSIEHFTGGTTWAGYDYTYDDASRITSIDSYLDGLSEYTHDDTNQLTSADHTGSTDEAYAYDANGNRTMSGYSTGDNNQLTSDGVYNYTYDAEGNRLTRTNISSGYVTEYTWDHRNRLTKVTEKDDMDNVLSTVEHSYDAFNRWIRRSADADGAGGSNPVETIFAYDGNQVSLEFTDNDGVDLDGDDLSHVYTWGPTVDQLLVDFTDGDVPQWALTDHLGTVRDFVEFDAGMTDTVDTGHRIFNSFGNITSQAGISSLIGFTGRPFDETTGLQNNLNRWYDPAVGRWVSEDPIKFVAGDINLSRYVTNSTLTNADSYGLWQQPRPTPIEDRIQAMIDQLIEEARKAGFAITIPTPEELDRMILRMQLAEIQRQIDTQKLTADSLLQPLPDTAPWFRNSRRGSGINIDVDAAIEEGRLVGGVRLYIGGDPGTAKIPGERAVEDKDKVADVLSVGKGVGRKVLKAIGEERFENWKQEEFGDYLKRHLRPLTDPINKLIDPCD